MTRKIKLIRPELKRQRDDLRRYKRYLPMLKLKQQLLQLAVREAELRWESVRRDYDEQLVRVLEYAAVLAAPAGLNIQQAVQPAQILKRTENIAGVEVPVFVGVQFKKVPYSLLGSPIWVDQTIRNLQRLASLRVEVDMMEERRVLLRRELARTLQRVNLFEEVKIPQTLEAMRIIRIYLGDQMTAMVGRSKMAKNRLSSKGGGI